MFSPSFVTYIVRNSREDDSTVCQLSWSLTVSLTEGVKGNPTLSQISSMKFAAFLTKAFLTTDYKTQIKLSLSTNLTVI